MRIWKLQANRSKGGYSEYITVSEDFVTRVPETMTSDYAAPLFCAGITAYKAVKAAEPEKNKKSCNIWNWWSRSYGNTVF